MGVVTLILVHKVRVHKSGFVSSRTHEPEPVANFGSCGHEPKAGGGILNFGSCSSPGSCPHESHTNLGGGKVGGYYLNFGSCGHEPEPEANFGSCGHKPWGWNLSKPMI